MSNDERRHSGAPARVLVLQHASWEKPGLFGRLVAERGMEQVTVRVDRGESFPEDVDAVLAMGGPMSVNDDLPWLRPEQEYIRRAVRAGSPYFGVCLGAQLLAASFGAAVAPAEAVYGIHTVQFDSPAFRDPLFGGLPRTLPVFQWHGENAQRPHHATALATSPGCPNEAFRVGDRAYGVQFHLEVDPELLDEWLNVPDCAAELIGSRGADGPSSTAAQLREQSVRMERFARRIFSGWLDLVAAHAARP
ncbi:type 1 glutamine amidotransferase [Streptomyces sp. NPDC051976]|uniref:type 1 glutamine amidotransferase n=1 Tax=Streptomyces sp. NPDC051976 TaxID=3154947 RepID=UPI003439D3D2